MKRYLSKYILLVSIFLVQTFYSQSQSLTFSKTYGGFANDEGHDIVSVPNGDFVITGVTGSKGDTSGDVYLLKIDATGDTIWQRTYGGSKKDEGNSVTATSDGHIFVAGQTNSYGKGGSDAYFLLVDSSGDTLWTRTYGSTGDDAANSAVLGSDGNYYAVGVLANGTDSSYGLLLKISPTGNIQWAKLFGGSGKNYFTKIKATPDGNFQLSGVNQLSGDDDIWLIKTDTAGNVVSGSDYVFHESDNQVMKGLGMAPDGGFLLAGSSTDSALTQSSLLLYRFDKTDTGVFWNNIVVNSVGSEINDVIYSETDTSWVICGSAYNGQHNSNDAFLLKTDDLGNIKWLNYFGGGENDEAKGLSLCNNGDIIFTGYTKSSGVGMKDVYVVRVSSGGDLLNGVPEHLTDNSFSVQPNPFSDYSLIKFSSSLINPTLTVYDLFGRTVKTISNVKSNSVRLDRGNLPAGVYFIQLTDGSQLIQTKKVVIN